MQKQFLIAAAIVGALSLSACQTAPAPAPAKAGLNDEAKMALAWAEADVKTAQSKGALWTTTEAELKAAKEAAAKGDSATVIKHAKLASAEAKLGLAQQQEPLMTLQH